MENINQDLIKKIKKGLIKAGFPLELKMAKILKDNEWTYSLGHHYLDFETGKNREFDISAEKRVNDIEVHLLIECKKSENTQLILYTPQKRNALKSLFFSTWFKAFPSLAWKKDSPFNQKDVGKAFSGLNLFSGEYFFSKNVIFTKGDKVNQDNTSFFSSLNGIVKRGIHIASDGYIETGFRTIFFYVVVYDGIMLQLSPSDEDDFNLAEIEYGQLEFEYRFKVLSHLWDQFGNGIQKFGQKNIIEVMQPQYLEKYLINISESISSINKETISGWGEDWPDITAGRNDSAPNKSS